MRRGKFGPPYATADRRIFLDALGGLNKSRKQQKEAAAMEARTTRNAKQSRKRKPKRKKGKPITSNTDAGSEKSEILNYDPRRGNRVEHLIELREFVIVGDDNTKVRSVFIPVSKLTEACAN